jgi:hypothetical protein
MLLRVWDLPFPETELKKDILTHMNENHASHAELWCGVDV